MFHPQRKTMDLLPLVCLCLLTWSAGTAADHSPGVVKVVVEEGSVAILPCSLSSKENIVDKFFDWQKDGQKKKEEVFVYDAGDHYNNGRTGQDQHFKGRVFHFEDQLKNGNASIKIRNTQLDDSGNYTCHFPHLEPRQTFHIKLVVDPDPERNILKDRTGENIQGAAPKPSVTILDQTTNWVLLYCEGFGDPLPELEWKDSAGTTLPAEKPQVSDRGGRPYIFLKTTVTKTDNFSCAATQKTIYHTISTHIYVRLNGAASKPYVTTRKTKDGMLLQCAVEGVSPKPKVEWKDSAGNILPAKEPQVTERGGSYDVIVQATVTKADTFTCVVTQEEINHQISAETDAEPLNEAQPQTADSTGLVVGVLVAVVISLIVGGCVGFVLAKRKMRGARTPV